MKRLGFFIFFSFVISLTYADAKNLYVNNSGSPVCSDSTTYANNAETSPWCSIIRATWGRTDGNRSASSNPSEAARAGDTVFVNSGTYNYGSVFTGNSQFDTLYEMANSGSAGNYITMQAVGTVELTSNTSGQAGIFGSDDQTYIKWKGFTVNQSNIGWRRGNAVIMVAGNYFWIEDCTVIGAYIDYGSDNNHSGIQAHGPGTTTCTGELLGFTLKGNKIYGFIGNNGRNDSGLTVYCFGSAVIENNEFYNNTTGIYAKSAYDDSEGVYVRKNLFYSNADAIALQSHSYWYITQNIFRGNSAGFNLFAQQYQQGTDKPRYVYLVNNTFYNNYWSFYWKTDTINSVNNCYTYNNIFSKSTDHAIYSESVPTSRMTTSQMRFDHNIWYSYPAFLDNATGGYSFANWQSATFGSQDLHSLNGVNPLFFNTGNNDFKLQTGSPARSRGVDILNLAGGGTSATIPAGAYITGNEVIGIDQGGDNSVVPVTPEGLRIVN